jgi:outer membrane protein assembly factor BamE (lipoprotein component of BamABCDE complex)
MMSACKDTRNGVSGSGIAEDVIRSRAWPGCQAFVQAAKIENTFKIMKATKAVLLSIGGLALCLVFCGCTTVQSTSGRDFDSSKVSRVEKGKTTSDEILAMFGRPAYKIPELDDDERWAYSFVTTTNVFHDVLDTRSEMTGYKKSLNILFNKQKVVVNYTMDEGPIDKESVIVHHF